MGFGGYHSDITCGIVRDMKQRAVRISDDLWDSISEKAAAEGLSNNAYIVKSLEGAVVAIAPTSGAVAPSADKRKEWGFARMVALIGPTAGYPYHSNEMNVKQTIVREDWLRKFDLPFEVNDIVAACYAAGHGDPWEGFMKARVREQLNDVLDDAGSRRAVLRARLRDIAGLTRP